MSMDKQGTDRALWQLSQETDDRVEEGNTDSALVVIEAAKDVIKKERER